MLDVVKVKTTNTVFHLPNPTNKEYTLCGMAVDGDMGTAQSVYERGNLNCEGCCQVVESCKHVHELSMAPPKGRKTQNL